MSDFKVGDRVRRTVSCLSGCDYPPHQVGWEGTVSEVFGSYLVVEGEAIAKIAAEKVEDEDERIAAWETIIKHPIFDVCFNTEGTLLDAVWDRLGDLYEMEQTINELKGEDVVTTEAQPYLSAAPNPAIRLEVLKLALSYGALDLTPKKIVKVADEFAAWVEGR